MALANIDVTRPTFGVSIPVNDITTARRGNKGRQQESRLMAWLVTVGGRASGVRRRSAHAAPVALVYHRHA